MNYPLLFTSFYTQLVQLLLGTESGYDFAEGQADQFKGRSFLFVLQFLNDWTGSVLLITFISNEV